MVKVKPIPPGAGEPAASTAHYVDEANRAGRSITLRIDDRPPRARSTTRTPAGC